MTKNETYIKFEPGRIEYACYFHTVPDGTKLLAYIPSLDLYFPAKDVDEAMGRAKKMVHSFLEYWVNEESRKSFFLQLHKLGFRMPELHDYKLQQLIVGKTFKGNFKSSKALLPKEFSESKEMSLNGEVALA